MILTYEDNEDGSEYKSKKWSKKPKAKKEIKPPKKISTRYLHNSGLAYLQRFPASSFHFKTVMMRKIQKSCYHHEDQNIDECTALLDELVEKFKELSLLDDNAYLKGMITSLRRRGLSSMQIGLRLQQKGYGRDDIKTELKKHDLDEYQTEEKGDIYAALVFARKKRLGPYDIENNRPPEKALATMARAGYSYDIAKKTIEMTSEELEEKLMRL
jgi:regulatory protein